MSSNQKREDSPGEEGGRSGKPSLSQNGYGEHSWVWGLAEVQKNTPGHIPNTAGQCAAAGGAEAEVAGKRTELGTHAHTPGIQSP
jgi:hypothetical protein